MNDEWVVLGPISLLISEGADDEAVREEGERLICTALEPLRESGKVKDIA